MTREILDPRKCASCWYCQSADGGDVCVLRYHSIDDVDPRFINCLPPLAQRQATEIVGRCERGAGLNWALGGYLVALAVIAYTIIRLLGPWRWLQ